MSELQSALSSRRRPETGFAGDGLHRGRQDGVPVGHGDPDADGADIESDTASLAGIVRTGCVRGDVHDWLATFLKDLVSGAP